MTEALPSADTLDQIVLAVPGVDALYSTAPLTAVIDLARHALAPRPTLPVTSTPVTSVLVAVQGDALVVAVKIGVAEGYSAADVCRRVHDALDVYLSTATRFSVAEVAVTVARIG